MPRVLDTEVKRILNTDMEDTTPFIETANILVDKVLGAAGLTEAQLTKIELFLAAHFSCMFDNREGEVEADTQRAKFEGKTDMGLDYTRYGQQVKILDTTGLFAQMDTSATEGRRQGAIKVAPRFEGTC